MDKINIREALPNLNEFCSEVSTKLIKWIKDNNLPHNLVSIGEREDILDLVESCPDIMFMMDVVREKYKDSVHLDSVVLYLSNMAMTTSMVKTNTSPVLVESFRTTRKFLKFNGIDRTVRARILLNSLVQVMYWGRSSMYTHHKSIEDMRKVIVLCLLNLDNFDYISRIKQQGLV